EEHLKNVQADRDHHAGRAPVVKPPDKPAKSDLIFDELHAVVGMIRRRRIVHGQKHSGDGLKYEKKQRGRAEDVDPARATGNRLIQQCFLERFELKSAIQPFKDAGGHRHAPRCRWWWGITFSTSSRTR